MGRYTRIGQGEIHENKSGYDSFLSEESRERQR